VNKYNPKGLRRDHRGRLLDKWGRTMEVDWDEFEKRRRTPGKPLKYPQVVNPLHAAAKLKSTVEAVNFDDPDQLLTRFTNFVVFTEVQKRNHRFQSYMLKYYYTDRVCSYGEGHEGHWTIHEPWAKRFLTVKAAEAAIMEIIKGQRYMDIFLAWDDPRGYQIAEVSPNGTDIVRRVPHQLRHPQARTAESIVDALLESNLEDRLMAVARKIKHCGDYGCLFYHPGLKTVHWTAADSDGSPDFTDLDEIKKMLKLPGVEEVVIGDEWSPGKEKGYQRLRYES